MEKILSFVGPHGIWIMDDKYRKLAGLDRVDDKASEPPIKVESLSGVEVVAQVDALGGPAQDELPLE